MERNGSKSFAGDEERRVRVFVSSTFGGMDGERNALLVLVWPALREVCRARNAELVEVDLRWGISDDQGVRRETLKLCLDEARACRPFFVGLLGERYGWVPGDDAFTPDLLEEQPWLQTFRGRSVTELEILHGVLNEPKYAGAAFFYFRDPAYATARGGAFLPENATADAQQAELKSRIRAASAAHGIPLREPYADPEALAQMVLSDLTAAIGTRFAVEAPDALTREAREHEAFARLRRRTYVARADYQLTLDGHAAGTGGPLLVLGESGSGKSALIANWIEQWRQAHPEDFVFQHYIGSTRDSAEHWRLMRRWVEEIRRWTGDTDELPVSNEDLSRTFSIWLARATSKAEKDGARCVVALDALNQLEDNDTARALGWLPVHSFEGRMRLIVSTLPGEALDALSQRNCRTLRVEPLTPTEQREIIDQYLARFGKRLDAHRRERIVATPAASNPLYSKTLIDELRVTGTHDRLDQRLAVYLAAPDIPTLLSQILARYVRDYERDRPGLVGEALSLIWAARRGLSESEILRLLKPAHLPQLPPGAWSPLRAALEESLVDRGGILNFAHDFLRAAVERAFVKDAGQCKQLRLRLADDFEAQPVSDRSCDELPWLLWQAESRSRLRAYLLDLGRVGASEQRSPGELLRYWVWLEEEREMGKHYLASFEPWCQAGDRDDANIAATAHALARLLRIGAQYAEAEWFHRKALAIDEQLFGPEDANVARDLQSLALLLQEMNRMPEAEQLHRRVLNIHERLMGPEHWLVGRDLSNLGLLLQSMDRLQEAESLGRKALAICERSLGNENPLVAISVANLALLLVATDRLPEAEQLFRRALDLSQRVFGQLHPVNATCLANLAALLQRANRPSEAEPLCRRALEIDRRAFGPDHPNVARDAMFLANLLLATNRWREAELLFRSSLAISERALGPTNPTVGTSLNSLAELLRETNRPHEAEPLYRRALDIDERAHGANHPMVARDLNNLALVVHATGRWQEAEPLLRRAIEINEQSLGLHHTTVAGCLSNLAELLRETNRPHEAEPLCRRALDIDELRLGKDHPSVARDLNNLALVAHATGRWQEAEPLYRRALDIHEQSFGPHHTMVAVSLNNLAELLRETNRSREAEPLYRRALDIHEQSFGLDHPSVARNLNNLALVLRETDRLKEAEAALRRALDISERSLDPNHTMIADCLNNLAELLRATNDLPQSESLHRRALEIHERALGPEHPSVARGLNNLALVLQATDRLPEAESSYRRALAIAERALGPHPIVAAFAANLAYLLVATKRRAEAEALFRRALAIDERACEGDHPSLIRDVDNLAALLARTKQYEEAEPLLVRALGMLERTLGPKHPRVALRFSDLVRVRRARRARLV